MLFVTEIECMYCKRTFDISRIHKSKRRLQQQQGVWNEKSGN